MRNKVLLKSFFLAVLFSFALIFVVFATAGNRSEDFAEEIQSPPSEMRALAERYDADRSLLQRSDRTPLSTEVLDRMQKFYTGWQAEIEKVNFDSMHQDGKIDYILLKNTVNHELGTLDTAAEGNDGDGAAVAVRADDRETGGSFAAHGKHGRGESGGDARELK